MKLLYGISLLTLATAAAVGFSIDSQSELNKVTSGEIENSEQTVWQFDKSKFNGIHRKTKLKLPNNSERAFRHKSIASQVDET
jgi:hypothetical protein